MLAIVGERRVPLRCSSVHWHVDVVQCSWTDLEKQNSLDVALLLPPCEPACSVLRWASLHPTDFSRTAKLKPISVQAPLLEGWTTQKSLFITFSKTSLCAGIIKDGINGWGKKYCIKILILGEKSVQVWKTVLVWDALGGAGIVVLIGKPKQAW